MENTHEIKQWVLSVIRSSQTLEQLKTAENLCRRAIKSKEDKIAYDFELKRNYLRLSLF